MGDWKSSVYLSYLDQLTSHIIDQMIIEVNLLRTCQYKFFFFSSFFSSSLGCAWGIVLINPMYTVLVLSQ